MPEPRCPECDGPQTFKAGGFPDPKRPCERCWRAWRWLIEGQDEELVAGWDQVRDMIRQRVGDPIALHGLRVVAWQNQVLSLAGFERDRRWFARRYLDVTKAVVGTDKDVVLYGPRPGATIARRIQRDKEK